MKKNNHFLLKCINCLNEKLLCEEFKLDGNRVMSGKLVCGSCNSQWPIINGVPRILKYNLLEKLVILKHPLFFKKYSTKFNFKIEKNIINENEKLKTAKSFGYEWNKYSKILDIFEKDWARYFNPFIISDWVKNKVVVDFGCGLAKHGHFTAKYGAQYVGIDLSDAVEDAYKNTKEFNSLIVQADIYDLPINGDKVDLFYSIGVIHHLPNPKEGFLQIAKNMTKKGAKILIWVYGKHKNKRALYLYNPIRILSTKIPESILDPLCHIPASIVHLLNLTSIGLEKINLKTLAKKVPFYYYTNFPYSFKHNDSFDVLSTPTQIYYTKKDMKDWFNSANISDVKIVYDKYQGIKCFGNK